LPLSDVMLVIFIFVIPFGWLVACWFAIYAHR